MFSSPNPSLALFTRWEFRRCGGDKGAALDPLPFVRQKEAKSVDASRKQFYKLTIEKPITALGSVCYIPVSSIERITPDGP